MIHSDPTGKFCYSLNDEWYSGLFDSPGAAAAQAETDIDSECEDGESREYHIAECCNPLDVINHDKRNLYLGEHIIEHIDQLCADEVAAEDWILDMNKEELAELGGIVMAFVRENASVQYYGIKNAVKHTYVAGSSEFNWEIAMHVRESLLSHIAEVKGGAA